MHEKQLDDGMHACRLWHQSCGMQAEIVKGLRLKLQIRHSITTCLVFTFMYVMTWVPVLVLVSKLWLVFAVHIRTRGVVRVNDECTHDLDLITVVLRINTHLNLKCDVDFFVNVLWRLFVQLSSALSDEVQLRISMHVARAVSFLFFAFACIMPHMHMSCLPLTEWMKCWKHKHSFWITLRTLQSASHLHHHCGRVLRCSTEHTSGICTNTIMNINYKSP